MTKIIKEQIKVFAALTGKKEVEGQIKEKGGKILSMTLTTEVVNVGFEQELMCTYNIVYEIKE